MEVAYLSHSCHPGHPSHLSHPIVIPATPVTPAILDTLVTLGTLVFPVTLVSTSTPVILINPCHPGPLIYSCHSTHPTLPMPIPVYGLGVRIHESGIWGNFGWYFWFWKFQTRRFCLVFYIKKQFMPEKRKFLGISTGYLHWLCGRNFKMICIPGHN